MRATFRRGIASETSADTLVVCLFDGEPVPTELDSALGGRLAGLVESGEAKTTLRKTATLHGNRAIEAARVITVGLGKRDDLDGEHARNAAAVAYRQASGAGAKSIAIAVPEGVDQATIGAAIAEGALLADYRFDRYKTKAAEAGEDESDRGRPEQLEIVSSEDIGQTISGTETVVASQNAARDLQNLPSNVLTPKELAEYAVERANEIGSLDVEVFGLEEIESREMNGLLSVTKGSDEPPKLVVLRYDGGGGTKMGIVGKAVTFDSGGISIKPGAKMEEMKFDMSGGAAAIEATVAIAKLGLPIKLLTVVPATENMPSGHATKPGDIVTISNGKTVEINNTDAEGRMILSDALVFAASEGADPIVDLATLTGAIITALGSTYAGLFSNDDELSAAIAAASDATGELTWRMPLHPDYKELTKGKFADLTNASSSRKASSAYAASFLEEFVDGKPWAHLDIAGTAWSQDGRDYVGNGASGWGVRLLVELARGLSRPFNE